MTGMGGTNNQGNLYSFDLTNQTSHILHSFGGASEGRSPTGTLLQSGNLLYGLTFLGGANDEGVLFAHNLTSDTTTTLHTFGAGSDGARPLYGSLLQSGNILYGVTTSGGSHDLGTLFAFDTLTNTETILHSFAGGLADGASPIGTLIQSGDYLYGVTSEGGAGNIGSGTVYALNLTTNQITLLHRFTGQGISNTGPVGPFTFSNNDGNTPSGNLLLSGDTLYGVTTYGGTYGAGTLFAISIPEPSSMLLLVAGMSVLIRRRT